VLDTRAGENDVDKEECGESDGGELELHGGSRAYWFWCWIGGSRESSGILWNCYASMSEQDYQFKAR